MGPGAVVQEIKGVEPQGAIEVRAWTGLVIHTAGPSWTIARTARPTCNQGRWSWRQRNRNGVVGSSPARFPSYTCWRYLLDTLHQELNNLTAMVSQSVLWLG